MAKEIKTYNLTRDDGSIFAVVNSYQEENGERFLKINVVEDSDWLHIVDMQNLSIQLTTLIMKLHYQDIKS